MARNLDPKCKQCRRVGEKLFLKGERCDTQKCAMVKRKYPPGVHGPKQKIRLSEYGLQLREKQKAKKIYGLLEGQFRNTYLKASKMKGDVGYNFLNLLEHRMDNVIYRAGLAPSRELARQIITHGHILINNKKMGVPSHVTKIGDLITVKETSKVKNRLEELYKSKNKKKELVGWLAFDDEKASLKVVSNLDAVDVPKNIDIRLIIEFYSK